MKKKVLTLIVAVVLLVMSALVMSAPVAFADEPKTSCNTIPEGNIVYSPNHFLAGQKITTGFNEYDTNYPAYNFNGWYVNAYFPKYGFPPYNGDLQEYISENPGVVNTTWYAFMNARMVMNWNDAWLSNKDCTGDFLLERHFGFDTFQGSGAWLISKASGTFVGSNGEACNWFYFSKIKAVPVDATLSEGFWYTPDGIEYGRDAGEGTAIIQEVVNDPCGLLPVATYNSPFNSGLGGY
jgi:hypothetical protein